MSMNSPDYLTYKKSKLSPQQEKMRRMSRYRVALWVFVITFSIIFAVVVQVVRKYSARIDIEYGRNSNSAISTNDSILSEGFGNDAKRAIDKRLKLIQLEENAPSEAKIIDGKDKNEVMDIEQFEKIKESGNTDESAVNLAVQQSTQEEALKQEQNVAVYSKVLIGKYATFEDARSAQDSVREYNNGTTPFIRKVGDIYALQVGSYQDLTVARQVASKFRAQNFDVWIYQ